MYLYVTARLAVLLFLCLLAPLVLGVNAGDPCTPPLGGQVQSLNYTWHRVDSGKRCCAEKKCLAEQEPKACEFDGGEAFCINCPAGYFQRDSLDSSKGVKCKRSYCGNGWVRVNSTCICDIENGFYDNPDYQGHCLHKRCTVGTELRKDGTCYDCRVGFFKAFESVGSCKPFTITKDMCPKGYKEGNATQDSQCDEEVVAPTPPPPTEYEKTTRDTVSSSPKAATTAILSTVIGVSPPSALSTSEKPDGTTTTAVVVSVVVLALFVLIALFVCCICARDGKIQRYIIFLLCRGDEICERPIDNTGPLTPTATSNSPSVEYIGLVVEKEHIDRSRKRQGPMEQNDETGSITEELQPLTQPAGALGAHIGTSGANAGVWDRSPGSGAEQGDYITWPNALNRLPRAGNLSPDSVESAYSWDRHASQHSLPSSSSETSLKGLGDGSQSPAAQGDSGVDSEAEHSLPWQGPTVGQFAVQGCSPFPRQSCKAPAMPPSYEEATSCNNTPTPTSDLNPNVFFIVNGQVNIGSNVRNAPIQTTIPDVHTSVYLSHVDPYENTAAFPLQESRDTDVKAV